MNYYEHHIGDYAAATSHLSWDEDMAYTRLIRAYYHHEKPIPADIKAACRIARAVTKPQRDAVQTVLDEFFTLESDGYHQKRCDVEVERYIAGEPEREVKKANENNRMKRHRDERADLFKRLTDAGQHASWNIKIDELRELVQRLDGDKPATPATAPVTQPATAPATPATATQTPYPDTRHQTPVGKPLSEVALTPVRPPSPDPPPPNATREGLLCRALRSAGIQDAAPHLLKHPDWQALLARRTDEEIIAVAASKVAANPGKRISLNYLGPALADESKPISPGGPSHDRNATRAATVAEFTGGARRSEPEAIDGIATRIA